MNKIFPLVALGGTFDRLHDGHKHFLTTAYNQADSLLVGVTTASMNTGKSYAHLIEAYDIRVENLETFLQTFNKPFRIAPLTDIYGETLTNVEIDALAVTTLTQSGAAQVNDKRESLGLKPLPIIEASMLINTHGEYLSSSLIRAGSINRSGFAYADLFLRDFILNENQKKLLRQPQGKLIESEKLLDQSHLQAATKVATVGDIVTQAFLRAKFRIDFAVVDFRSQNNEHIWEPQAYWEHDISTIYNPAGQITHAASSRLLKQVTLGPHLFVVEGEEDLLALPLVLSLPLGSLLYYGQPNEGVVELTITEHLKSTFLTFCQQC